MTLSTIEQAKPKVEAERELPAFAAVYGKPIAISTKPWNYPPHTQSYSTYARLRNAAILAVSLPPRRRRYGYFYVSPVTIDLDALTQRDKLELAAELIHNILQKT